MQRRQATHAIERAQPAIATLNIVNALAATAALPNVAVLPATATLDAVPALPPTAMLSRVAVLPATAILLDVRDEPATAELSRVFVLPATALRSLPVGCSVERSGSVVCTFRDRCSHRANGRVRVGAADPCNRL
jgi:hypothetical protein